MTCSTPMSSSAWPSASAAWPSSSPACGRSVSPLSSDRQPGSVAPSTDILLSLPFEPSSSPSPKFASGNTFGATAFSAYGGFWLSFAAIYWPSSGILGASYAEGELASALGIYVRPRPGPLIRRKRSPARPFLPLQLITWFVFTFLMWFGTFKSSIGLFSVFFFLYVCALVGLCPFNGCRKHFAYRSPPFFPSQLDHLPPARHRRVPGVEHGPQGWRRNGSRHRLVRHPSGIWRSRVAETHSFSTDLSCAFYTGISGILTPETSYFTLPTGDLSRGFPGKAKSQ
jgi:succinate-acetate transporter protein